MSALVLVASSDPKRLARLKKMVEHHGAVALAAHDACEAMHLFVRRSPDLTLLHLDEGIGLELCRDIRSLRAGRHAALMVVGPQAMRAPAFAAGCNTFIQQQVDPGHVERAIRGFLTVNRRRRAASDSIEFVA